jgi:hypothetical protein
MSLREIKFKRSSNMQNIKLAQFANTSSLRKCKNCGDRQVYKVWDKTLIGKVGWEVWCYTCGYKE